jgi:hypothetical protein
MGFVDRSKDRYPEGRDPERQPIRHVWVKPSAQYGSMTPWPGLLIEWRRNSAGEWLALVAVISGGVGSGFTVQWHKAEQVVPAKGYEQPGATSRASTA